MTPFPCSAKLASDRSEQVHAHSVHGYGIFSWFKQTKVEPPPVRSSAAAVEEGGRYACFICLDDSGILLANVCGCYSSHVHAKCLAQLQASDGRCRVCTQPFRRAETEKPFLWQKPSRAWAAIASSTVLICFATFYLVRMPRTVHLVSHDVTHRNCAWRVQLSGFAMLNGSLTDACLKILTGVLVLVHSMMVIMYVLSERFDPRDGRSRW